MPLRLAFTAQANDDVDELLEFISLDSPQAANAVARRLEKSLRLLTERPYMGRVAPETGQPGMRRMSVLPI